MPDLNLHLNKFKDNHQYKKISENEKQISASNKTDNDIKS